MSTDIKITPEQKEPFIVKVVKFMEHHWLPVLIILSMLIAVFVLGRLLEGYQTGVNPFDKFLMALMAVMLLGPAWIMQHLIMKFHFTTHYEYCRTGTKEMSDYRKDFISDMSPAARERIRSATHAQIGAWVCAVLIVAFAAG